jgi:hypothetical protein
MPDSFADFVDISAHLFADICHFINKADLRGQHTVGNVFDHLSAFDADRNERLFCTQKRSIQFLHDVRGFGIIDTYDDAVRFGKVINRSAFLQEFRIGA